MPRPDFQKTVADGLTLFSQGAAIVDGAQLLTDLGLDPDPWQLGLLRSASQRLLLLCSRQSGKSTATAVLALHTALYRGPALILLLSPSLRQSQELFRKVLSFYRQLGRPVAPEAENALSLEMHNGSRIVSLPSSEETIRGYSGVSLLIIDEAARVPDILYRSVTPMLAVSKGRLVALSTPFGKRGWFHHEWTEGGEWERTRITADQCPRITPAFLDQERVSHGEAWVRQEYYADFTLMEGLVYPDLPGCVSEGPAPEYGRCFAGVDWGYHNPAAIVVGRLSGDDVLWLVEEVYGSKLTHEDLAHQARALAERYPIEKFYCDPAEPSNIQLFRRFDLPALGAMNRILPGVQAVNHRIRTGRLKVLRCCKNLLKEAELYRYPNESERKIMGENPVDEHNHALSAVRYAIAGIDRVREAKKPVQRPQPAEPEPSPDERPRTEDPASLSSEELERRYYEQANRDHLNHYGWETH